VNRNEVRHRVIATLLKADGPLARDELLALCELPESDVQPVLAELVGSGQVVEGLLVPGRAAPQYRWAARWAERTRREAADSRKRLSWAVDPGEILPERKLEIDSPHVWAFHRYVIDEYSPPADKRLLVILQCSVRRPFSSSPSHASMRRAIRVATGADPARDFEACDVHVVVLASRIGPVPYELEDVYPANVGGGGVKHFRDEQYGRVRPILAARMAEYLTARRGSYDHMAAFTDGRYGEVMRDARRIAGADLPVFPRRDGPAIVRMGRSKPRTYWQKYWIQLYLEIVRWLARPGQAAAKRRLEELDVVYR